MRSVTRKEFKRMDHSQCTVKLHSIDLNLEWLGRRPGQFVPVSAWEECPLYEQRKDEIERLNALKCCTTVHCSAECRRRYIEENR